jgi:MFS family permease
MASADIEFHQRDSIHLSEDVIESEMPSAEAPDNAQPAMLPVSRQRQFSILICSFFAVFITIGMNQSYGVFLTYYLDPINSKHESFLPANQLNSKALMAFVGTLGAGLTWGGSIFVNPLMARVQDPRRITLAGASLIGLGYVLASFSRNVGCPTHLSYCSGMELTRARSGSCC